VYTIRKRGCCKQIINPDRVPDHLAQDIGIGDLFHKAAEVHHIIGHWSSSGSRLYFENQSFTQRTINGYRHHPGGYCTIEDAQQGSWLSRATPRPGTSPGVKGSDIIIAQQKTPPEMSLILCLPAHHQKPIW